MKRWRVSVTRVSVFEIQAEDPDAAGRAGLVAAFSDPGPYSGSVLIEPVDPAGAAGAVELDLSKVDPQGSA